MKKSLWLGLVFLVLTALLAACGSGQPADTNEAAGEENSETAVEEKQQLIVGTEAAFAPFEFLDKGEIVGFDIDLLAAVMEEAGFEHEVRNLGWDPLFVAVQNGEVDLAISGITITDDRIESYDFTRPYYESTHMILVPEDSDIKSATDLVGKKVGVQNGTTGQFAVEKILGENHSDILKYESSAVAIMALKNGDVEAVVTDNAVVNEYLKNNPNDNFVGIEDPENFESEFYGLMFPKGSELVEIFNEALTTVIESGTYAEIYEKWFGTTPDVETLLNAE
ncbi:polar amino acid transport system substrate-binding protein [Caldalkalibacillus uzonensis]|uniref:Polar amino acid transport system substrate-binding protein n=1 Tax=Caldalkalibacillus uzonensis TaxID=353224 RepID=A0ABU0CUQ2_9BACI|nr:basic amino acid ABC transporter substrate-binding protein [Caldalkalibacillus uzonensis]MDQ0340085.1 polar amino acid transport system substrate-binding protein [Caldalkalibacillus uzonensis]